MNKIKIAVLGLGVVGSHVVKLLEKNSYILDDTKCEIVAIGAKNKKKKRIINISKYRASRRSGNDGPQRFCTNYWERSMWKIERFNTKA